MTDLADSRRTNDLLTIAAAMVVGGMVVLRGVGATYGVGLDGGVLAIAILAYVVSVGRRDWPLLTAAAGIVAAAALGWLVAVVVGQPWEVTSWAALVWLLAVWAPWPAFNTRVSLLVLWVLAWGPLLMLLAGPPLGRVVWAEALITGERLNGLTGWNEVGVPAGIAVLAALALRLQRDTWVRYGLVAVNLVLVGAAGTRSMFPGVGVAALLWYVHRNRGIYWRGFVTEAVPWVLFFLASLRPALLRTTASLESGLDQATNNRGQILSEYWAHAREALPGGHGLGATDALLESGEVSVDYLPHNGFMTLTIDVGVPAMLIMTAALVAYVVYRCRQIKGPMAWLLRVPLLVFLPMLYLVDHGLWKAFLTVPILLFSSAAPWVGDHLEGASVGASAGQDGKDRLAKEEEVVSE